MRKLCRLAIGIGISVAVVSTGLVYLHKHNIKQQKTQVIKVYLPQIASETKEFESSINFLYENPIAETAQRAKSAARRNWLISYLYCNELPEDKRKEIFNTFISNTERCIEGLKLLKGQYDKDMYSCSVALERYRSLARIVLLEGPYSPRVEDRINRELELPTNEESYKQQYEWREKVRSYVDIGPHYDDIAFALFEPNKSD